MLYRNSCDKKKSLFERFLIFLAPASPMYAISKSKTTNIWFLLISPNHVLLARRHQDKEKNHKTILLSLDIHATVLSSFQNEYKQ